MTYTIPVPLQTLRAFAREKRIPAHSLIRAALAGRLRGVTRPVPGGPYRVADRVALEACLAEAAQSVAFRGAK